MNKNKDINLVPTLITLITLSLIWWVYADFGTKYGSYINSREEDEILLFCSLIGFVSAIVFIFTREKHNIFKNIAKAPINRQINNKMESEISEYIRIIKGLGDEELGLALLSALTLRKSILVSSKIDLMDPIIALQKSTQITFTLSKKHEELTAQQKSHLTVPFTIWIHTLRSVSNPVIRTLGRQMWKELSRGFKHIEEKKETYRMIYGNEPISELAGQFPIGLDPSDIEKNDGVIKEELSFQDKEVKLKEYLELQKKGLITKEALTNLQIELLSDKNRNM